MGLVKLLLLVATVIFSTASAPPFLGRGPKMCAVWLFWPLNYCVCF